MTFEQSKMLAIAVQNLKKYHIMIFFKQRRNERFLVVDFLRCELGQQV